MIPTQHTLTEAQDCLLRPRRNGMEGVVDTSQLYSFSPPPAFSFTLLCKRAWVFPVELALCGLIQIKNAR